MTSAHRSVSESAVMVIAGVISIALLAKERKAIYRRKDEHLRKNVAREEHTITEWQLSHQNEPRGRWTVRLIDNLYPWLNRKQGEMDYFLTQLLSGQKVFNLTCTGLGRCDLLIVYSAIAWRTKLNTPVSLAKCEKTFLAALWRHRGALSKQHFREMLKNAGRWSRVVHYVRALLIGKKIELDHRRDRMARDSLN